MSISEFVQESKVSEGPRTSSNNVDEHGSCWFDVLSVRYERGSFTFEIDSIGRSELLNSDGEDFGSFFSASRESELAIIVAH